MTALRAVLHDTNLRTTSAVPIDLGAIPAQKFPLEFSHDAEDSRPHAILAKIYELSPDDSIGFWI
jgi:hypothetical protein